MKAIVLIFSFCLSTLALTAQGTTYKIPDLPVEFSYNKDFKLRQDGKRSWTVFSEETGTEFYINLYKVGVRFNADSLRYLMLSLYEGGDPNEAVTNIQVNEVGTGSMGPHPAEKFIMSFVSAEGKLYVNTAYLVHFQINRKYNSLLFYFEIGEKNVTSYAQIQEAMISSLKYTEFIYQKYNYAQDSVQIDYPNFWTAEAQTENDKPYLLIDDGRCRITLSSYIPKDSTTVGTYADAERDAWKKDVSNYPNLKIKSGTEKCKNGDMQAKNSGTFYKQFDGVTKTVTFSKYFLRRQVGNRKKDFVLYFECPELNFSYYDPIFRKIYDSMVLPGNIVEAK